MTKKFFVINLILISLFCIFPYSLEADTAPTTTTTTTPATYVETADQPSYNLEVPIGSKKQINSLAEYVRTIYRFGIIVAAILAITMITFGGFRWVLAGGNEGEITKAKETVIAAIMGLVIGLLSYTILYTVNPDLVLLTGLRVPKIMIKDEAAASTVVCNWAAKAETGYTKVADTSCTGSKTNSTDSCYCNIYGAILASAANDAAANKLCWGCCGGWVAAVYDSALTTWNPQSSKDPATVVPGDWIIEDNHTPGKHALLFLGWTDFSNLKGTCMSANPDPPRQHSCDFKANPIYTVIKPKLKTTHDNDVGVTYCGMTAPNKASPPCSP